MPKIPTRRDSNAKEHAAMNERIQALAYGALLALIVGWVLHVGKDVFIPIVFGILAVYVIVGLTRLLQRIPVIGAALPLRLRYALSVLLIGWGVFEVVYLVIASADNIAALAPHYQATLLAAIQEVAAFFRVESEPTWTTLRQDFLAQINLQALVGSMVASLSSFVVSVVVMLLYATFLLFEQRSFSGKIGHLSTDPRAVARIRQITTDVNTRVGSYLALKTALGILLAALSWIVMKFVGLELAGFWAVLIWLLNYVPYLGSFLGVLFPALMAIVQFGNPGEVVAVLLPLTVIQFLIGNFLDPYVMGSSLNLSPFVILVALAAWSSLWGIAGAFLAVPITAIMAIVFSEFAGTRPIAVLLSRSGRV
jgi:predicted PurR-regulated permease PerM